MLIKLLILCYQPIHMHKILKFSMIGIHLQLMYKKICMIGRKISTLFIYAHILHFTDKVIDV